MRRNKFTFQLKLGKTFICLTILSLFFTFSPNAKSALATPGSGGPNTGLPDHLVLSWAEDPLTTQTIAWRTGSDTAQGLVQYLPAEDFNGSFTGAGEVAGEKTGLYEGHFHFEATLRELTPGTDYVYRVGREGAWSEPATFTTAGAEEQFSFLYMGDVQEGHEAWGEMLEQVAAENPDLKFALLGGDLVNQGNSIWEWQQFFAAASPVFRQLPLMPAAGNHDDTELFHNSFALPQNGPKGYEDTVYSFDYGNCHITVLNSNCMGIPGIGDYDQIAGWLQNDLAGSNQQWKILVFHHPPYPVVHDWRADVLQEHWVPLFEQGGVDMVFVGHQHVYMRTKPLRGGQIQPDGEGIVYVMGNAGSKHYGPGPAYDYIAEQSAWTSNYQIIDINGDTLTMTSRDAAGNIIDSYLLVKVQDHGKVHLEKTINEILVLDEMKFTSASWRLLEDSLQIAQIILSLEHAAQASLVQVLARLTNARERLIEKPDKTFLEAAINTARSLDSADYTPRSWKRMSYALNIAVSIYENGGAAQEAVDLALCRLNNALNGLVERKE